jgi:hypothetical protein
VARLIDKERKITPQKEDFTPNRGVLNQIPCTEELVKRFQDERGALKEG